ncbi:MAG: response regulator [Pseudohongiellaceae bacterium]
MEDKDRKDRKDRKRRILLVDDNRSLGATVKRQLADHDCECTVMASGMDALCEIMDNRPDMILVDIDAPELNGLQLCALLKNHQEYRAISVVLLADKSDIFLQARAQALQAELILTKPFARTELLKAVAAEISHAA